MSTRKPKKRDWAYNEAKRILPWETEPYWKNVARALRRVAKREYERGRKDGRDGFEAAESRAKSIIAGVKP